MHKKWQQRCCAWLVAGAMVMTGIPSLSLSAQGLEAAEQEQTSQALEAVQEDKAADAEMGGYLWLNFGTEGGYEKIFYGYSEDGLTWTKLNKVDGVSQPILATDKLAGSDKGVRDPHIIRSAEGDKYWILGTDLHAEGGGDGGSGWDQLNASQKLVIWESEDLVNWSEPRLVHAGFDNAGCVWAPEAIYDETQGNYAVYWSARDKSKAGTNENALRVYVCRTTDFVEFTEPKVWLSEDQDTGGEVNIIDSTIVKGDDGKFYRFSTSDWNTIIDVSDTLDTEDVLDVRYGESASKPNGSWKRLVTRSGSDAAGFDGREGLTVYKLPNGSWCVMGDNQGYRAFLTTDLASGSFTAGNASFPDGKFRHGTVMRLTKEEDARVREAFKDRESEAEAPIEEPVLSYDFEGDTGNTITDSGKGDSTSYDGTLYGKAKVVYDEERNSNVLTLDGSNGTYAQIPTGFFDKRNVMTISMDVKSELDSGNFFTFTYGKDSTFYDFLRIRGSDVRNAITVSGNGGEQDVRGSGAVTGQWQKVVLVIDRANMKLYLDGSLVSENKNTGILTSNLGKDLLAYLGKSFYGPDAYFKGSFDNFKVYNRALSEDEIIADVIGTVPILKNAVIGTAPDRETALTYRGTDDHTAVFSKIDRENKVIIPYVRTGTNLKELPMTLDLLKNDAKVTIDGKSYTGGTLDLTKDVTLEVSLAGKTETYTIKKAQIARNPVLPGQYADPDIDYFDGKFWIYPTTDGYPSWSGTVFHAFSSPDMENWEDEGIIMELMNQNPGLNDKGVQIANSPWAVEGSAWAPTIEEKNGKYYFYYCGKLSGGKSAIGVAVADNPAGPYTDKGEALMTVDMCTRAGVQMGQAIDPSIFTDTDGKSYILFGNTNAAIAELNDDMMSIKAGTLKQINGLTGFRESVIVMEKDGKYHWTWTDDDANSPNYHVNYGVSDKLIQDNGKVNVTFKKSNLLSKDESMGMLGTGHQSVLHVQDANGEDRYFMAYHRFYMPLNIFTDGLGVHRTTCIDEIFFDENDEMTITPTLEGVPAVIMANEDGSVTLEPSISQQGTGFDINVPEFTPGQDTAVSVVLPDAMADSIKNSDGKEVSVNVNIPDALTGSEKADMGTITLPKKVLEAAKESKKDLIITVNGSSSYQWVFSAADLANAQISDLNLLLDVDSAKEDADVKTLLKADETGKVVSFTQQDNLSAGKVVIDGKDLDWDEGEEITLSYYNPNTKKLEQSKTYTIGKDGKATIPAAKSGKYVLWRQNVPVTGITLSKSSLSLFTGENQTLTATVRPSNATKKKCTWSSDKPNVADVDQNGKVTAKSEGTAKITVETSNGVKVSCSVTVKNPIRVSTVTLNKKKLTLGVKEKFTLKATVKPANATNRKVTWKSEKPSIVTVSTSGAVQAKKAGKATITAMADGKKATCTMQVKAAPKKITLNVSKKTLKKGKTFQIKVKLPKNTASNKITYSSNKKKIASVSSTGKVKALKKGKAVITVKSFNGKKAKLTITVK